ncbi:hypothetical protein G4B88_021734 [Cannabis sativa]|uniref:DUF4283 domain-containing protein n=1 Tax=Cannabis sativa TaxID=3483 RepID=A0A7J6FAZ6_CANSA|nr:hypothetical protein G4B88_021734 [Cannabis sativa]
MASASSRNFPKEIDEEVTLDIEEFGGLSLDVEEEEEYDVRWCLVGRFLNAGVIDVQAMQHIMAFLWKPGKGLYVKELEQNRFLFQFYHELDIKRVIGGSPWTFERKQLIFERLKVGDNLRSIILNRLDLWVQIHDLQHGFRTERTRNTGRSSRRQPGGTVVEQKLGPEFEENNEYNIDINMTHVGEGDTHALMREELTTPLIDNGKHAPPCKILLSQKRSRKTLMT